MSWLYGSDTEKFGEVYESIDQVVRDQTKFIITLSGNVSLSNEDKINLCRKIKEIDPDFCITCRVLRVDSRLPPQRGKEVSRGELIDSSGKGERSYPVEKEFNALSDPHSEPFLLITNKGEITFTQTEFGTYQLKQVLERGKETMLERVLDTLAQAYGIDKH
ncbi:MAG: hypothetical protein GWO20_14120 [Candidatus Korarchaeota archaeon]|nr:hypothetical protein [Candidatus Korarchaeota archaeon]NIU84546.1 hypothetical protein [Candidatus Thorarchaeota archaeon]NIW14613.1 hypothetical protein [Candidatus Thorarchaeota archaeon]NIW52685.1 hypothetical protein [Candidatus Korarchaeota archaeon]